MYHGAFGHTYSFYSIAHDNVGNVQLLTGIPNAVIEVLFPLGDVDGSGDVSLADLILTLQSMSKAEDLDREVNILADVNGDTRIGLEEAVYILQCLSGKR